MRWFVGMTCLVLSNSVNLVLPLFIGTAMDYMTKSPEYPDGRFDQVGPLCGYLMIVVVFSAIFIGIRGYIFNSMSERIAYDLRKDFFKFIINQDVAFFDEQKSGDLLSRLNNDI